MIDYLFNNTGKMIFEDVIDQEQEIRLEGKRVIREIDEEIKRAQHSDWKN